MQHHAAHAEPLEELDRVVVGEAAHVGDQLGREHGVEARAPVDRRGKAVGRPQQVSPVVLGAFGGQVKLRGRDLAEARRRVGNRRLGLVVEWVERQPAALDDEAQEEQRR